MKVKSFMIELNIDSMVVDAGATRFSYNIKKTRA